MPTPCRSERWEGTKEWNVHLDKYPNAKADTEADARDKILVYLIEKGIYDVAKPSEDTIH